MAGQSRQVVVVCAPDAQGRMFVEDWSDVAGVLDSPPAARYRDYRPGRPLGTYEVRADDGLVGSKFLRVTQPGPATDAVWTLQRWFDPRKALSARFKARMHRANESFLSYLVWYCGEHTYDGPVNWADQWFDPDYGWSGPGSADLSLYHTPAIPPGSMVTDEVGLIETYLDPTSGDTYARKNGGAWANGNRGRLAWPVNVWYGIAAPLDQQAAIVDYGLLEIFGWPVFGGVDFQGFDTWDLNGCGFIGGADSSLVPGGMTGNFAGYTAAGTVFSYAGYTGLSGFSTKDGTWSAQSPAIVPQSGHYDDLRYECAAGSSRVYTGSDIRIYVRDAVTGNLLSDAQVPGNSAGIVGTGAAAAGPGTDGNTRVISLAAVPTTTTIYLDVQGSTHAGGFAPNQPRLAALWVTFKPGLSVMSTKLGPGSYWLFGQRTSGQSVTVT